MENSFKSIVDGSGSVLILLSKSPYFDQVAAGLSLYLALDQAGKNVSVSCPSEMVVEFSRLVGVQKVTEELGGKNLVLKFKDYNAQDIERVTYDIENKEFRLSVIPKPQASPPEKEQIQIGYSGASADTIVLIGGANESHFPALATKELATAKLVHIGIMGLNIESGRKLISFSRSSSSVSELMAGYIKQVSDKFSPDIASNLLAGMHEGSKNFSTSYVSANTFKIAGELMEAGGRYAGRDSDTKEYTARDFGQENKTSVPPTQAPKPAPALEAATEPQKPAGKNGHEKQPDDNAPKSWLEPKIFKGTSVS